MRSGEISRSKFVRRSEDLRGYRLVSDSGGGGKTGRMSMVRAKRW